MEETLMHHDASRPPARDRLGRVAGSALAGLAVVVGVLGWGSTSSLAAAPVVAAQVPGTTLSGVYGNAGNLASVQAFEVWRGREIGIVSDFLDASTWSTIADPWMLSTWGASRYRVAYAVPMLPTQGSATLQVGATGAYDSTFAALGRNLVAKGEADAILRIGWEMNGDWMRWSAVSDPASYVAYWRHIVDALRSTPGQHFVFEWAPNNGEGVAGFNPASAYPGDAYVDLVGTSFYDQSWAHTPDQDDERWNWLVYSPYGLQWAVNFATAHGKHNSLPEWGLSYRCDAHGGNDDPGYINKIAAWVAEHDYFYESYFNFAGTDSCVDQYALSNAAFPLGRAAYLAAFGPPAPAGTATATSSPTPTPSPTATMSPCLVRVSTNATRTPATALQGAVLTGTVYVFAVPDFTTSKVRFYLDDPFMLSAPMTTEGMAPWDLKGGELKRANPFDSTALSAGRHTLTTAFETASGQRVLTSSFTARGADGN